MRSGGRGVRVAGTTKDPKVGVGGSGEKRAKWGEGVRSPLCVKGLGGRWQHEGSQPSNGPEGKPRTIESA
jgi:hypothetical protein